MGHRANLIVVRDGRYDLRYSHWAANTLPRDLFWGPEHAVAFTEAQPAGGADGWLDDVWAEGGSVIDTDSRVFRLFGGEDLQYDVPLRRLYLALLGAAWDGWDVGWAHEGIADLADHVGYPRDRVLTAKPDEGFVPDLRPPEQPDWVDFVGSVRPGDGRQKHFPLAGNVADYLLAGPVLADVAAGKPGPDQLSLAERTSSFPHGGFDLDVRSRCLNYWTAGDQPGVPARIAARWPGWSVTWLRDRYELQLAAAGGSLSFPDRTTDALFVELRAMLLRPPGRSPAETVLWLADHEREAGKTVEVNPNALRDDRVEYPVDQRVRILDRVAGRLGLNPTAGTSG
jgi:hypothetical protein